MRDRRRAGRGADRGRGGRPAPARVPLGGRLPAPRARRPAARVRPALSVPVLLAGDVSWDPAWSREVPLTAESPRLAPTDRERLWTTALGDATPVPAPPASRSRADRPRRPVGAAHRDPRRAARRPRPAPGGRPGAERRRARTSRPPHRAGRRLDGPGAAPTPSPCSCASSPPGRGTASRCSPSGGCGRAAAAGIGVTALFAGDSGTGKTMSAEVIAGELGLDLYRVDLATVVDKYVGETEKNLERIFTEAGGRQRRAAVRRGRRDLRQAQRGARRPRPLRQHRERLPAAAHGDLRRPGDPGDQPAREHRRGLHPPARRASSTSRRRPRSCGCSCGRTASAPPLPLGDDLDLSFCASRVRAHRRQHPLRRDHRRLPRGGGGPRRSGWRS